MKIIFIFYTVFLILFTLFSYLFVDVNLVYFPSFLRTGIFGSQRQIVTGLYILFLLGMFSFLSIFFYQLVIRKSLNLQYIITLIAIAIVALIFSYPAMVSHDIFNYITTAKVAYFYKENPYIIMPIEFIGDPNLEFTHAANKVALYGPSWLLLTFVPFFMGQGNFIATLFLFKTFVLVFYIGTCYCLWKLERRKEILLLFALNPLVLIEVLVGGHNDVVMVFFALLSIIFLKKEKTVMSLTFLFVSILIKYATLFLLPIYIYVLWKQITKKIINWKYVYTAMGISMLCVFLLAPLREEIYPWYAVWFLPFFHLSTFPKKKILLLTLFSGTLLLRYIPFMLLGTHFGITPLLKNLFTFLPISLATICVFISERYKKAI